MDEQAKILINGEWYGVGAMECAENSDGHKYLTDSGRHVVQCPAIDTVVRMRHVLTPLPSDNEFARKMRLGEDVLDSVPAHVRKKVMSYREPSGGETFWSHILGHEASIASTASATRIPLVILSPPPAPTKTAEQLLADILRARSEHPHYFTEALDAAEKWEAEK